MNNPNMAKVPTIKELWEKERSEHRPWMILFGIGLLVVLALMIASLIVALVSKSEIISSQEDYYRQTDSSLSEIGVEQKAYKYFLMKVIFPSVASLLISISLILYAHSLYVSYKSKSFEHISGLPLTVMTIGFFYSSVQIITDLISFSGSTSGTSGILSFISPYVFVAIYIFVGSKVSKIRNEFKRSSFVEKNPQMFGNVQQGMSPMPNNPFVNTRNAQFNKPVNIQENEVVAPTQEQERLEKLKAMSKNQLEILAKKLSISGFETMNKDSLIQTIIRISKNDSTK